MSGEMTHLDPNVLAEFRAGLITGRRGARISAHLSACDRCTALGDELAQVSALLTAAPGPAMPDSVAQRLDVALAAEVADRDYSERIDGHRPRHRERWQRPAWTRDFRLVALRVLAPAAAVVLLAAGGAELTQHGSSSQMQATSPAAGPSSAAGQSSAAAGAAARPASGVAAPLAGPLKSSAPAARTQRIPSAPFPVVISTTNFVPVILKQQIEAALATPAPQETRGSLASVQACVQAVAGRVSPTLVESARYEGQPATLIVVPASQGDVAWLAGSRCSAADHDVLARTTVP